MDMVLFLMYTILGAVAFSYLFVRFLRKGACDSQRNKWERFFSHGLDVNRKISSDPSYLVYFVALMIGLMSFAASVGLLLQHFIATQK